MEMGAPFCFGVGLGAGVGVSVAWGVGVALGEAVGVSDSAGVGEILRCFFGDAVGDSSGAGVGEIFLRRVGDGEGLGVGVSVARGELFGLGFADGVGEGDDSFFFVDVVLRCLRGVGVGVGSKIFLILSPSDSSAGALTAANAQTAAIMSKNRGPAFIELLRQQSPAGSLCSNECRHRDFRAENFR